MKYIIIFFLSLLVFSCNTDISTLLTKTVSWEELPEKVKFALINSENESFINIDSILFAVDYKNTAIVGLYPGKHKYYLNNGKCLYLDWNGNKEVHPFVFYDSKIYFLFDPIGGGPMFKTDAVLKGYKYKILTIE